MQKKLQLYCYGCWYLLPLVRVCCHQLLEERPCCLARTSSPSTKGLPPGEVS